MSITKKADTLAWPNESKKELSLQTEIPIDLYLQVVKDNLCTKQALLESENRTREEIKAVELKVELKIAELQMNLMLKITEVKNDLGLEMEKIKKRFVQMKAELNSQIAKWVLGVSLLQTTVILSFIRFMH